MRRSKPFPAATGLVATCAAFGIHPRDAGGAAAAPLDRVSAARQRRGASGFANRLLAASVFGVGRMSR
jgi:hypothetical protein